MNIEFLMKVAILVCALVGVWNIITLKMVRFRTTNRLKICNGKHEIYTYIENKGHPVIQVNCVQLLGFRFVKNDGSIQSCSAIITAARIMEDFLNSSCQMNYCSDYAITHQASEFPARLERYESQTVIIDIEKMIDVYIETEETFGNRWWLLLDILFLKIEYNLNDGKCKQCRVNWQVKWYLISKHLSNKNLYMP